MTCHDLSMQSGCTAGPPNPPRHAWPDVHRQPHYPPLPVPTLVCHDSWLSASAQRTTVAHPLHWLHRLYIHYWQKAQLRNVTEKIKMHCTMLAEAKQRKPTDQWRTVADNGLHAIAIGLIQQGWDHLQSRTSSSLDDGNSFKQLLCATRSHIMQCSQGDYANYANLILQSSKNLKRTKAKGRGHFQSQNWKRTLGAFFSEACMQITRSASYYENNRVSC